MRYPIVLEAGANNLSAFAPDVPGCVATGSDRASTLKEMESALEFHL